jgi:hypothetical protein
MKPSSQAYVRCPTRVPAHKVVGEYQFSPLPRYNWILSSIRESISAFTSRAVFALTLSTSMAFNIVFTSIFLLYVLEGPRQGYPEIKLNFPIYLIDAFVPGAPRSVPGGQYVKSPGKIGISTKERGTRLPLAAAGISWNPSERFCGDGD